MKSIVALIFVLHLVFAQQEVFGPNIEAKTFVRNWACGSTIRQKSVVITNPPQPVRECTYRIQAANWNVLQLRIDFDIALQAPVLPVDTPQSPVTVPTCVQDEFTAGTFRFCGINRGQHIYVPFNVTRQNWFQRSILLRFRVADRFSQSGLSAPFWRLRITQIEVPFGVDRSLSSPLSFRSIQADSETDIANEVDKPTDIGKLHGRTFGNRVDGWLRAPNGCLQYFPDSEGIIESFNFNQGRGPYLPNQNYFICFRRRETDTRITLTFESFGLASIQPNDPGYDANCLLPTAVAAASEDFLFVPNAVTQEGTRVNRLCGNTVHTRVIVATQPGPFAIQFQSDNRYNARVFTEAGFRIQYKID